MAAMIEVQNLTKYYGSLRAISELSFSIAGGQVVGFLGPNGAGKSTTLRILCGYQPASSGSARVAGFDVFNQSRQMRAHIGYLPESTPLYPEMRVREYLRFRARLKGVSGAQISRRIEQVNGQCWLAEFINRPIGQLSKGMRQRVGLADALINDPQVLFLDEPTIGLDPTQIRETRHLIGSLGEKHTVVLSSHILSEVEATCNEVIIIARGHKVAQGRPRELGAQVAGQSSLIVEVQAPAAALQAAVAALDGVRQVQVHENDGWLRVRVEPQGGNDLRQPLSRLIQQKGWPLRELRREVASLEDYFVKIVAGQ
ncbi:MAG: Vitamin B12 import ATP-binding protein BtuD [Phycisphaerae bacterium]|nr:Vitamin B12 import ATP-binding protein BtuD [Phycisphaerae bacterium]